MNLIEAEYTLDCNKIIFVYVADERVDFRELLKELAGIFKCRIELRQIGQEINQTSWWSWYVWYGNMLFSFYE